MSAIGQWEQLLGWADSGVLTSRSDNRRWNGAGTLTFGPPILGGQLSYDRREQDARQRTSGQPWSVSPTLISDSLGLSTGWRPAGGPSVDLRVARTTEQDSERLLADRNAINASLAARYAELRDLDFRGAITYGRANDDLRGTQSEELTQSLAVRWNDAWLRRRILATASYSIGRRDSRVSASRPDAEFLLQQLPTEGRSRACAARPCPLPTLGELLLNAQLVDGDLTASAGLDLGFGVTPADLTRELGVGFADPTTQVNRVFVYVDRPVPQALARALAWTPYRSDDGVNWTPVSGPITAGVSFGLFENRFEIPIPLVRARYLKLVTTPLTVTTESALAQLLVTEVQVFWARAAAEAVGTSSDTSGSLAGTLRARLEERYNSAYDFGFFLTHGRRNSWNVLNGLTASRALGRFSSWNARLDRSDSGGDGGHAASTRLSATLNSDPLPTLGGALSAGAGFTEDAVGVGWSASTSVLARADLYRGVSLGALGTAGLGRASSGLESRSVSGSLSTSIVPHRTTTLTGGYTISSAQFDRQPWDRRSRLEAAASFAPFPALSLAGSVARTEELGRPATLASFSVSASPFRGGDLALSFGYNDAIDTSAEQRTRQWGPGLRWNVRPGSQLTVGYSVQQTRGEALDTDGQSLFANLVVTLR